MKVTSWYKRKFGWIPRPVRQVIGSDEVYVYHTKINTKPAIEGTVWQWHQDYGSWQRDGCPRPDMATFNVMMTDTTEMGGALYLIPGSHRLGRIEPFFDESTAYKFWAIPKARMIEVLRNAPPSRGSRASARPSARPCAMRRRPSSPLPGCHSPEARS